MGDQTEERCATQVIGADDVLAADASRAVGRPAEVLGVVAAADFFAEREAAQRYHYGRVLRSYGRPRGGRVRVGRSANFDVDDD